MKRSFSLKLILSYLAVAFITVIVVSVVIRLTSGQSLSNLVIDQQTGMLTDAVQNYYIANGTLDGFYEYYTQTNPSYTSPDPKSNPGDTNSTLNFRGLQGLVDTEYRSLIPTGKYAVGDIVPDDKIYNPIAVKVNGETIAWVLPDKQDQVKLNTFEEEFLTRTNIAIGFAALAGVIVAVIMGVILATGQLKPIRRIMTASKELARGNLDQQIPVASQDEFGQLTETFNKMSQELVKADEQRKRLTADITHDLGTPIQIISGYLEMFEDENVSMTPERIEIVRTELNHLRRLVGDLSTLSQAEAGGLEIQIQPESPVTLMENVYQVFKPICERQGIDLVLDIKDPIPEISIDEGRMTQVLKNLVENALRFTSHAGKIILRASNDASVRLQVIDSGTGIDPEDLPFIFDRFYKADKSRGGNPGKMGLGLAICKALVNAQGGEISAVSGGKDCGTTMTITFKSAGTASHNHK